MLGRGARARLSWMQPQMWRVQLASATRAVERRRLVGFQATSELWYVVSSTSGVSHLCCLESFQPCCGRVRIVKCCTCFDTHDCLQDGVQWALTKVVVDKTKRHSTPIGTKCHSCFEDWSHNFKLVCDWPTYAHDCKHDPQMQTQKNEILKHTAEPKARDYPLESVSREFEQCLRLQTPVLVANGAWVRGVTQTSRMPKLQPDVPMVRIPCDDMDGSWEDGYCFKDDGRAILPEKGLRRGFLETTIRDVRRSELLGEGNHMYKDQGAQVMANLVQERRKDIADMLKVGVGVEEFMKEWADKRAAASASIDADALGTCTGDDENAIVEFEGVAATAETLVQTPPRGKKGLRSMGSTDTLDVGGVVASGDTPQQSPRSEPDAGDADSFATGHASVTRARYVCGKVNVGRMPSVSQSWCVQVRSCGRSVACRHYQSIVCYACTSLLLCAPALWTGHATVDRIVSAHPIAGLMLKPMDGRTRNAIKRQIVKLLSDRKTRAEGVRLDSWFKLAQVAEEMNPVKIGNIPADQLSTMVDTMQETGVTLPTPVAKALFLARVDEKAALAEYMALPGMLDPWAQATTLYARAPLLSGLALEPEKKTLIFTHVFIKTHVLELMEGCPSTAARLLDLLRKCASMWSDVDIIELDDLSATNHTVSMSTFDAMEALLDANKTWRQLLRLT